jgi:hypothetical protein
VKGSIMTEEANSTPSGDPDEEGADQAGSSENIDAGGYGGPGPEVEVAPGFDPDMDSDG